MPRLKYPPRLIAEKLAKASTRWIALRWGHTFPFYYVSEHPKSGGTWLARMIADYLQLPFPQFTLLPLAFRCVIQNHWRYDPRLSRVFYLYRDGRDVMVSFYFDRIRIARHSDRPGAQMQRATYERLFGKAYDPDDIVRHLPRFIEHEFAHPGRGTPLNWRDHVEEWHRAKGRDDLAFLSYEQLREDCAGTLGRALERQTGRRPGAADISQHIRKGVVGDWRNHFSREAAELFDRLAGAALVELGYEADRAWVDRYSYPTP